MADPFTLVRLGTRGSALARWQTEHVCDLLRAAWPGLGTHVQIMTTYGDRTQEQGIPLPAIGGKGAFTAELEAALLSGEIDVAVHSLKDLPTDNPPGLVIGAIPARGKVHDVLVSRAGWTLERLPRGATVGTGSRRRSAQLLHHRPDLQIVDIRGNVDTRISKALADDSPYDAILLAEAGLERLGKRYAASEILRHYIMLPAPGQGALAVQCRDEEASLKLLAPIRHVKTTLAVTAERAFLAALGGGCSLPVAAYGVVQGDWLRLRGRVTSLDGQTQIDVQQIGETTPDGAEILGTELAQLALSRGSARLLEGIT